MFDAIKLCSFARECHFFESGSDYFFGFYMKFFYGRYEICNSLLFQCVFLDRISDFLYHLLYVSIFIYIILIRFVFFF